MSVEPVAWQYRYKIEGSNGEWQTSCLKYRDEELNPVTYEQRPLYAHRLPAASFQAGAEAMREAAAKVADQYDLDMSKSQLDDRDIEHIQLGAVRGSQENAAAIRELPIPASSEGR